MLFVKFYYQTGGWTPGYTFHGDAIREFCGGDNPFAGKTICD